MLTTSIEFASPGKRETPTTLSSSITTKDIAMEHFPLPTPGDILKEEFLDPMGLSQYALAKAIKVDPMRISDIIRGKRAITADTGLRLSKYFGMNPAFFTGIQLDYDTELARRELAEVLETITPRAA